MSSACPGSRSAASPKYQTVTCASSLHSALTGSAGLGNSMTAAPVSPCGTGGAAAAAARNRLDTGRRARMLAKNWAVVGRGAAGPVEGSTAGGGS